MKVALDTNVLVYAEGVNDDGKRGIALELVRGLPQEAAIIPVQVLGELFNVLVRKAGRSRTDARDALLAWRDSFAVVETSPEVVLSAADLATDHRLGIWDAVVLRRLPCRLQVASVRRPARRLHMGRGDGRQSIRVAASCPAGIAAGKGRRIEPPSYLPPILRHCRTAFVSFPVHRSMPFHACLSSIEHRRHGRQRTEAGTI